jgi:hypothetical protein
MSFARYPLVARSLQCCPTIRRSLQLRRDSAVVYNYKRQQNKREKEYEYLLRSFICKMNKTEL